MKNENKKSNTLSIVCLCLIIGLGCTGIGYGLGSLFGNSLSEDEQKLIDAYRLLEDEWLFGNEEGYLAEKAINGVLSVTDENGDPYTFYTPNQEEQNLSTDGKGFGFSTHSYDGGYYVRVVQPKSPADEAGLKEGDVLTGVNIQGEEIIFSEHTSTENNAYLAKDLGEDPFLFRVKRGEESKEIPIVKGAYSDRLISVDQVPGESNGDTLRIKIDTFLGDPTSALEGTLKNYEGKVKHLVLDLRGNGGGYTSQAEDMARLFLEKGSKIDQLADKNGKVLSTAKQKGNPTFSYDQISLLIDSKTASAAECFTLAMRQLNNVKVYGFTSYGKGIAQNFKSFSDGSVIRYTFAYVYGPQREGEKMYGEDSEWICIHQKGIQPDVAYTTDYSFLNSVADYTTSIGVSKAAQDHFINALNFLYPGVYPTSYSGSYHFVDLVEDYASDLYEKTGDTRFQIAFNSDGTMNKAVNDRFTKECYDEYLRQEKLCGEFPNGVR